MNSLTPQLSGFLTAEFSPPDSNTLAAYLSALTKLGLPEECTLAQVCLKSAVPAFEDEEQSKEIDNVLWATAYGGYETALTWTREVVGASNHQFPLTSFEGEYGYVYDAGTDAVFEVEFGDSAQLFEQGKLEPRWNTLDLFFRWFFSLDS